MERSREAISRDGLVSHAMKINFEPDPAVSSSWGMVSRPFIYPQDWSTYGKLSFWVFSENPGGVGMKIKIKDREGEPFESKPIYLYESGWKQISLDLKNDFVRGPSLPNYGNNQFDRDGVRESSFELSAQKKGIKSVIYLDDLTLK
jgi:hypothetical protein